MIWTSRENDLLPIVESTTATGNIWILIDSMLFGHFQRYFLTFLICRKMIFFFGNNKRRIIQYCYIELQITQSLTIQGHYKPISGISVEVCGIVETESVKRRLWTNSTAKETKYFWNQISISAFDMRAICRRNTLFD